MTPEVVLQKIKFLNREITYSDQLGSGMRKLYRDVPLYSGIKERPQFLDGDIFRLVVPMDDIIPAAGESGQESSPKSGQKTEIIGEKSGQEMSDNKSDNLLDNSNLSTELSDKLSDKMSDKSSPKSGQKSEKWPEKWPKKWPEKITQILDLMSKDANITIEKLEEHLDLGHTIIKKMLSEMQAENLIRRVGPDKGGHWEVINQN